MWIIGLIYINLNPPASTFTEGLHSTDATGSFHFKYLYMVHTWRNMDTRERLRAE